MYYSYAEKKGSLFSGWSVREVALDCSRRYFYYSEAVKEPMVVPCSGPPIVLISQTNEGVRRYSATNKERESEKTEGGGKGSMVSDISCLRKSRGTNLSSSGLESPSSGSFGGSLAHSLPTSSPLNGIHDGSHGASSARVANDRVAPPLPRRRPPPLQESENVEDERDDVLGGAGGGVGLTQTRHCVPSTFSPFAQENDNRSATSPLASNGGSNSDVGGNNSPRSREARGNRHSRSRSGSIHRRGGGGDVGSGSEPYRSPNPRSRQTGRRRYSTPPPPHPPHAVVWKGKIKVDCIACAAHNHEFKTYDPHLKENDFYQIELGGEVRPLSKGEIPPPEPLLCSSTGLSGMPGRCVLDNDEFIRDPFFQKELYDSLKVLFSNIRLEQVSAALRDQREFEPPPYRTITSPRGSGGREDFLTHASEPSAHNTPTAETARGGGGGSSEGTFPSSSVNAAAGSHSVTSSLIPPASSSSAHTAIPSALSSSLTGKILGKGVDRAYYTFRFRTEYEFRRFLYVLKTVLGYDKLTLRPYRGFPPYDPRNGIILAHLPLYRWHSFKCLQKTMIYAFVRGDLYGRTADNSRTVMLLKGGFLCITHDSAVVLRDEGRPYCKLRLLHVEHFRYQYNCLHPYCAFISDVGHTDIFFVPQPPLFGEDSISRFHPKEEVMRIRHIVYETCFCSLGIRRVIDLKEAPYPHVLAFIDAYIQEFERIRVDLLEPNTPGAIPNESFPGVWSAAQDHIRQLRQARLHHFSEPAIPLYENHTNHLLSTKKLEAIRHRLTESRQAENQDEITAVAVEDGDSGEDSSSTEEEDDFEEEVPACFQQMAEYMPAT